MEKYQFTNEQRSLLEGLQQPFAIFQFTDKGMLTLILSEGFCRLFGYADHAQAYYDIEHSVYGDTHPDDVSRTADAAYRFAVKGEDYDVVYRTRLRSGSGYRIIHAAGKMVDTPNGVRLAHVWYTDEGLYEEGLGVAGSRLSQSLSSALHEESLLKASRYDYLTGLLNMSWFFEVADDIKDKILANHGSPAMLYIDFSGMKFFNTKNGFEKGDAMLKTFARTLGKVFYTENCCRIAADHFAVATDENGLGEKLEQIIREMNDNRYPPFHVGIYPVAFENVHPSVACDRAKMACNSLKGKYQSAWVYYDDSIRSGAMRKQYIVENIDRAIQEKWIEVYYQPIVRAVNESICDEEALARWIDPVNGLLSPAEFIPYLEESGLIWKLDLYMLEQVLEKMKQQAAASLHLVPQSINLSRADFDGRDMVEEIRRRVDAAGIDRRYITIEITESVIGSDFAFMKAQVERFQRLNFAVWMDDFGSGYSSLYLLQSIKFNLLKFDMSFLRRLDEDNDGRIILTELMRMASSLGVDTVCEGVETVEQARFLQEIGCSKLQGYYFSKPIPFREIMKRHCADAEFDYENPDESAYYETIGRVNLYDLAVLANAEEDNFQNTFNTLPMGIIEVKDDAARFMRSNQSYRDFIFRFFHFDLANQGCADFAKFDNSFMFNVVKNCCSHSSRTFFDEKMPDGSVVHSFAHRIGINPVSGNVAVAVAVLSISDPSDSATYGDIARALAADYYNICAVDLDTEQYIEYSSPVGKEEMAMERHGERFFDAIRQSHGRIYEEDREYFFSRFTKERIIQALETQGTFMLTYRVEDTGEPIYVSMKATRMPGEGNRIIIGVNIIDAQMKQKAKLEALQKERDSLTRVMALSDGYRTMYTVDLETGQFVAYSSTDDHGSFGNTKNGGDFFQQARADAKKIVLPEDLPAFRSRFTLENVLREAREAGKFVLRYSLVINGKPQPVMLKATTFREGGREKLVIGVREWREIRAERVTE